MPINFITDSNNYYQKEEIIFSKIRAGISLTPFERYLHCKCLPDTALLRYDCFDELYLRLYWQSRPQLQQEIIFMKKKSQNRLNFEAFAYEELLKDWEREISKVYETDQLLNTSNKETNNELKLLTRERILSCLTLEEFNHRKYEIISWSKYRYISAKMISDILFTNGVYELKFDQSIIILDLEALLHIISTHFGAIIKLFTHSKSHFTQDFYHEDLPLQLQDIFSTIDVSNLYVGQLKNKNPKLVFRFNNLVYELFFRRIGGNKRYRIKTFYPADENRTNEIINSHEELFINSKLSFLKPIY